LNFTSGSFLPTFCVHGTMISLLPHKQFLKSRWDLNNTSVYEKRNNGINDYNAMPQYISFLSYT